MTITANLADGRVLNFPDGTDPTVIQQTVKRVMGLEGPEPPKIQSNAEQVRQEGFQQLAQETGPLQTGLISVGRGLDKIARAVGIKAFGLGEEEDPTTKQAFEALGRERPVITTVGEAVGESLPFAAVPVGAIAGTGARVAATAGLGALEGGLIRRGEGGSESQQIRGAGTGAAIAGGLEAISPFIGRIGSKIIKKVFNRAPKGPLLKPNGLPTEEFEQALDKSGLTFEDLKEGATEFIEAQKPGAEPEQVARASFFESQGLIDEAAPTSAQVTRDPTQFQRQQELSKTTGPVRARLESQQGLLVNKFDETIAGTSGKPVTSGNPVVDAVTNKITTADNKISELYKQARKNTNNEPVVQLNRFFGELSKRRADNDLTGGLVSSIEGLAKEQGVLDPETGVFALVSVEDAEKFVQSINKRYKGTNDFGRLVSRELKDAIDLDVAKSGGEQLFKTARQEKAKLEAQLRTVGASKRSKRAKSLIKDIIEEKVNPEDFLNASVLSKTFRANELKDLKKFLTIGDPDQVKAGKQAWNDLRAETLDYIKNKSFVGPEDAAGNRNLSRIQLERSIDRIGREKMSALFEPEEIKFLNDMIKVSRLLEPVRGTALGKGPTAQAIESLQRRIDKIPVLNVFVDLQLDGSGKILKGKPVVRQSNIPLKQRLLKDAQSGVPLTGTALLTEEERAND